MKHIVFTTIIAFSFIILFLYTGASKLLDYSVFKEQIATSPILAPVAGWIGIVLPLSEFAAAILLFFPPWRLYGLYVTSVLMLLFTAYISAILIFDKQLPCSCGGIIELLSWKAHLLLNSLLILLAFVALLLERRSRTTPPIQVP